MVQGNPEHPEELFTDGERDFIWTMESSVQNGPWNRYGSHGDGISKRDFKRLDRILRKVYGDILYEELMGDSDDESDSDDE